MGWKIKGKQGVPGKKGDPGTGTVNSVNDVFPDANGNVELDILVPDLSDYAKVADVGDKEELATTEKGTLVKAINEVFTSGNNVKSGTVDALLSIDGSLPIDQNSSWIDVINAISGIDVGGILAATGSISSTVDREDFETVNAGTTSKPYVSFDFSSLSFKPYIISFIFSDRNIARITHWYSFNYYEVPNGDSANCIVDRDYLRVPYSNNVVSIPVENLLRQYDWIAFGEVD